MTDTPCLFDGETLRPGRPWPFAGLAPMSYGLIVADPPWRFDNWSEKGQAKGPEPHYPTMADEDILALPAGELARPDCMLWLWATWPKLPLAMAVIDAWGFEYVTGGAWDKKRWGTGYVWRSVCEPILIATRGDPNVRGRDVPNLISSARGRHSAKPAAALTMAERMCPNVPRVELFARSRRKGWDAWGNELPEPTQHDGAAGVAEGAPDRDQAKELAP